MTRNPILNALAALIYISLVATIMFYGSKLFGPVNSFIAPIALISLFTLSAAVMGYVFFFQPAQLYFDGNKKEGINLFLQTVAAFGVITLIIFALLFSGVFSSKKKAPPAANMPGSTAPDTLPDKTGQGTSAAIANPAAAYCIEQGGKSTITTAADGSQGGICVFPDGRQCEEWSFFRTKACSR
jgi:putative hemolysin